MGIVSRHCKDKTWDRCKTDFSPSGRL